MHGTIIQTGVKCNEIPCYMRTSACGFRIIKKADYFAGMRYRRILADL